MIQQVRVTLPNRPGTLERMVRALADAGVGLKALDVSDRGGGDHGEANFIPTDLAKAAQALEESDHQFVVEEALAVEMDDRVGGLAAILVVLAREQVNIKQVYAFVTRMKGKSLAVLSVDDLQRARDLLGKEGFHLLSKKTLQEVTTHREEETTLSDHLGLDFIW